VPNTSRNTEWTFHQRQLRQLTSASVTGLASYALLDAVYYARLIETGQTAVAAEHDRIAKFLA